MTLLAAKVLDDIALTAGWKTALSSEFEQPYMQNLTAFLMTESAKGTVIYPAQSEYFRALDLTPLNQVRVVILGQDPYHGAGQAHGLSFSVPPGVRIPPSLRNIYKELQSDLDIQPRTDGVLEGWAKQGVLLLNSVLSVEEAKAGAHQGKGWEQFTDAIIRTVADTQDNVVFLLWGAYAQKKASFVDTDKHLVLTAPHPSPLSAHRGFLGCQHFSKTNDYLKSCGYTPIDWSQ